MTATGLGALLMGPGRRFCVDEMQLELRELHARSETAFIFVTHDQEEASVLSDTIAVLHDGRIEQLGSPAEIYDAVSRDLL